MKHHKNYSVAFKHLRIILSWWYFAFKYKYLMSNTKFQTLSLCRNVLVMNILSVWIKSCKAKHHRFWRWKEENCGVEAKQMKNHVWVNNLGGERFYESVPRNLPAILSKWQIFWVFRLVCGKCENEWSGSMIRSYDQV